MTTGLMVELLPTPVPASIKPLPTPVPTARIETLVRAVRIEAQDIRSFELVAPFGERLPEWLPGAHVQLFLPDALSDQAVTRAYSICNHAGERDCYRIAVKLEAQSRGGSRAMHQLSPGDRLQISPPRNLFALDDTAQRHVFIAGGIGITPLYAMLNSVRGDVHCELHYFARSPLHAAFSEYLDGRASLHTGLDAMSTSAALRAIVRRCSSAAHTTFYTCGPSAFMDAVANALVETGIPATQLRSERFGSAPVAALSVPARDTFRVVFARSNVEAEVPVGVPIIAVARAHGVSMPTSCEQGVCGACLSDVLEGEPAHLDAYLSDAERASGMLMLPCVSRCVGARLVLDR